MRRAARTDANHSAIVQAFRDMGCGVISLAGVGDGCPDLLISRRRKALNGSGKVTVLVEVKDGDKPPSAQRLTAAQIDFHACWQGEIFICKSIVEVPGIVAQLN